VQKIDHRLLDGVRIFLKSSACMHADDDMGFLYFLPVYRRLH